MNAPIRKTTLMRQSAATDGARASTSRAEDILVTRTGGSDGNFIGIRADTGETVTVYLRGAGEGVDAAKIERRKVTVEKMLAKRKFATDPGVEIGGSVLFQNCWKMPDGRIGAEWPVVMTHDPEEGVVVTVMAGLRASPSTAAKPWANTTLLWPGLGHGGLRDAAAAERFGFIEPVVTKDIGAARAAITRLLEHGDAAAIRMVFGENNVASLTIRPDINKPERPARPAKDIIDRAFSMYGVDDFVTKNQADIEVMQLRTIFLGPNAATSMVTTPRGQQRIARSKPENDKPGVLFSPSFVPIRMTDKSKIDGRTTPYVAGFEYNRLTKGVELEDAITFASTEFLTSAPQEAAPEAPAAEESASYSLDATAEFPDLRGINDTPVEHGHDDLPPDADAAPAVPAAATPADAMPPDIPVAAPVPSAAASAAERVRNLSKRYAGKA